MMENKTKIDLKNKSIFITGAAGFIGSNLAKRLLSTVEGVKVVGLDNMNTQEPIIDQQTFDTVQKLRENVRRYPDGWGEHHVLTGLMYCADCGAKMYVHRTSKGDYLFPNLAVKDEPQIIGKYGMLRRTYLKENRRNWYQSMLMSGRLNQHLAQIEEAAESRVETLLDSLNEKFPAPSKEKDPLAWAANQNNLTAMAEEIVLKELVYN